MITLYVKSPCQYSAHALAALDIYNVPFTEKNIADPVFEAELLKIGGRHKVPFLVDGDIHLYESDEIVAYIAKQYGNNVLEQKPVIHKDSSAETCSI